MTELSMYYISAWKLSFCQISSKS